MLVLARSGDAELILEALTASGQIPRLLHELAIRTDIASAGPAALVAYTAATTPAEVATAVFYMAVAATTAGDHTQGRDLVRQARSVDPGQVSAWINELAEIGQYHHVVLHLIPELTTSAVRPEQSAPQPEDIQ